RIAPVVSRVTSLKPVLGLSPAEYEDRSSGRSSITGRGRERVGGRPVLSRKITITSISSGGGSGIRTHDGLAPMPVFKTGALNHSAISPQNVAPALSHGSRLDANIV